MPQSGLRTQHCGAVLEYGRRTFGGTARSRPAKTLKTVRKRFPIRKENSYGPVPRGFHSSISR